MVGHVTPEAAEGPGNIFFCWYLLVGCWMLVGVGWVLVHCSCLMFY